MGSGSLSGCTVQWRQEKDTRQAEQQRSNAKSERRSRSNQTAISAPKMGINRLRIAPFEAVDQLTPSVMPTCAIQLTAYFGQKELAAQLPCGSELLRNVSSAGQNPQADHGDEVEREKRNGQRAETRPARSLTATPCPAHSRFAAISSKTAESRRAFPGEFAIAFPGPGGVAACERQKHRLHLSCPRKYEARHHPRQRTPERSNVWHPGPRSDQGLQRRRHRRRQSSLPRESLLSVARDTSSSQASEPRPHSL